MSWLPSSILNKSRRLLLAVTVFIPGFKGSTLSDANHNVVWVKLAHALSLSTPELNLPIKWQNERQELDGVQATQVLDSVKIVPHLIENDVYGSWLTFAEKKLSSFSAFYYDWRRDNLETLDKFHTFILALKNKHPDEPINLVGHSMGGLLSLALINRAPELVAKVVFVGVPFAGGIGFLVDLHEGTATGFNGKILSPEVLATYPSLFSLFPLTHSALKHADGSEVKMDFYQVSDWQAQNLGPFARPMESEYPAFLEKTLAHAKRFRELLKFKPGSKYPKMAVVIGNAYPSLATAWTDGEKSVKGWDFTSAPKAEGDGRVVAANAKMPEGFTPHVFYSSAEHAQLLSDEKTAQFVADFFK